MYDVLYQGNEPPATIKGLEVIDAGVDEEELAARFAVGRGTNSNFNIIVRSGGATYYWYPRAEEES